MELHPQDTERSPVREGRLSSLRGVLGTLWRFVGRVPLGLWAALGVALGVLGLYLRGRRLEGEIAKAKVALETERAKAALAQKRVSAAAHHTKALRHVERVSKLESARDLVRTAAREEQHRLSGMSPSEVHKAYLELAARKRRERPQ